MMHDLIRRTDIVSKITSAEMQAQFREMSGREAYTAFIIALNDAPTIDAVPVIRCKDCKHRGSDMCPMETVELDPWFGSKNDDFCSYGERRSE